MNSNDSNVQLLGKDLGLLCRLQLIENLRTAINEQLSAIAAIYEDDWENAYERLDIILQSIELDNRKNAGMLLGLMGRLLGEEGSRNPDPYQ